MEKLVVIPTYNERENISKMISKVMSLEGGYHLLVVDDGSPDGTGAIVKERQAGVPERLFLLERPGKKGVGTAYFGGFRWGLGRPAYVAAVDVLLRLAVCADRDGDARLRCDGRIRRL